MIDPETVLERALRAIEASARPGGIVRSGHVAAQLLQEYPDFEMSAPNSVRRYSSWLRPRDFRSSSVTGCSLTRTALARRLWLQQTCQPPVKTVAGRVERTDDKCHPDADHGAPQYVAQIVSADEYAGPGYQRCCNEKPNGAIPFVG